MLGHLGGETLGSQHEMRIVYLATPTTPDSDCLPFSPLRKELAFLLDVAEPRAQVSEPEHGDSAGPPV